MKILITGANGFIGRALCAHLFNMGHEVIPVVRKKVGIKNEKIISEQQSWKHLLHECEAVIHLAAISHVFESKEKSSKDIYKKVNVDLTLDLAREAILAGVGQFIFMSTIKVNGEITGINEYFDVSSNPNPQHEYGKSKWEAEQSLLMLCKNSNMNLVIIRSPIVYGPGVRGNFDLLIKLVKLGIPLPFKGLANFRSMVALDNLTDFIAHCINSSFFPGENGRTYLIADGPALSTPDLLMKISEAYQLRLQLFWVPPKLLRFIAYCFGAQRILDRLTESLVIQNSETTELLGWKPCITMDEQLRKMANATRD